MVTTTRIRIQLVTFIFQLSTFTFQLSTFIFPIIAFHFAQAVRDTAASNHHYYGTGTIPLHRERQQLKRNQRLSSHRWLLRGSCLVLLFGTAQSFQPHNIPTCHRHHCHRSGRLHLADTHSVHWLDSEAQEACIKENVPLGESIAEGECVLTIPNGASTQECTKLLQAALQARDKRSKPAARGRSRFSVSDPDNFGAESGVVLLTEEILLRVIDYLEEAVPSIYNTLFAPGPHWAEWQPLDASLSQPSTPPDFGPEECDGLRELYVTGQLEWSEGEPAINIYEEKGYFGCHKDHLALTILIPLVNPEESFSGGGTGFWAGNRETSENPGTPPDLVLKPPAGTALVFGGDVTHSGMPVQDGLRSVLVCSFSTKTPASNPDRLHGLHAPPSTSANFKGTA